MDRLGSSERRRDHPRGAGGGAPALLRAGRASRTRAPGLARAPRQSRASAPAASAALEAGEERARIERACARLPERQREVFEMRVLANLTHAEIAALLGIREDASRASYYQALRKLRAELEDEA